MKSNTPHSTFDNDFLRLKVSFLTKTTKNEVFWTVYMSYVSNMTMLMLNEKKSTLPIPFPLSLPPLCNFLSAKIGWPLTLISTKSQRPSPNYQLNAYLALSWGIINLLNLYAVSFAFWFFAIASEPSMIMASLQGIWRCWVYFKFRFMQIVVNNISSMKPLNV